MLPPSLSLPQHCSTQSQSSDYTWGVVEMQSGWEEERSTEGLLGTVKTLDWLNCTIKSHQLHVFSLPESEYIWTWVSCLKLAFDFQRHKLFCDAILCDMYSNLTASLPKDEAPLLTFPSSFLVTSTHSHCHSCNGFVDRATFVGCRERSMEG